MDRYTAMLHWPLMGGLVHLVQCRGAWAGCVPQSLPRCIRFLFAFYRNRCDILHHLRDTASYWSKKAEVL